jgi:cell division initiation protein
MVITPLDVLQKQFQAARRAGYDPEDVQDFLDQIREAWEADREEAHRLREDARLKNTEISLLRQEQEEIRETLVMARRISVDTEAQARREADLVVGEARLESERILAVAHEEQRRIQEDLVRMKSMRIQSIAQLRAQLEMGTGLLREIEHMDQTIPARAPAGGAPRG